MREYAEHLPKPLQVWAAGPAGFQWKLLDPFEDAEDADVADLLLRQVAEQF